MAAPAQITQSMIVGGTLQNATVNITQSYIIAAVGLGVSCNSPPAGTIGAAYTHTFISGSGVAPVVFAISAGSPPPGLSLDPSTGILSGTPSVAGTFPFTVMVTDALGATAFAACSVMVTGAKNLYVQLIGWKLYPVDECAPAEVEAPTIPDVERAV